MWLELYQNDISPNHWRETCRESERAHSSQVLYLSKQSVPNITEIRELTSTLGEVYSMQRFVNVLSLTYNKSMDISGPTGILHQEN